MYIWSCHTLFNNTVLVPTAHPRAQVHTPEQSTPASIGSTAHLPCTSARPFTLKTPGKVNPLHLSQMTSDLSSLGLCISCSFCLPCHWVQPTLKPSKGPAFAHERQSPRSPTGQHKISHLQGYIWPLLSPMSPPPGCGWEAREQGYEEKWKSAPIAADIMASRLRCSWTPKQ